MTSDELEKIINRQDDPHGLLVDAARTLPRERDEARKAKHEEPDVCGLCSECARTSARDYLQAIAQEREACADIADSEVVHSRDQDSTLCAVAERIAAAIRARTP